MSNDHIRIDNANFSYESLKKSLFSGEGLDFLRWVLSYVSSKIWSIHLFIQLSNKTHTFIVFVRIISRSILLDLIMSNKRNHSDFILVSNGRSVSFKTNRD